MGLSRIRERFPVLDVRSTSRESRATIMYMKIVTEGTVRHLCVIDQSANDSMTLCGRTVTQDHSWKLITSLEGDECLKCAELAFGGIASA